MAVEPHFYGWLWARGGVELLGLSLMNAGRWHEVMQCQHRIAKAKSLNGGLGVLFREGDKREEKAQD